MVAARFEETDTRLWCSCCGWSKDISAFSPDPTRTRGYRHWCKACENTKRDQRRARHYAKTRQTYLAPLHL